MRNSLLTAIALGAALTASSITSLSAQQIRQPLKVGFIASFSGAAQVYGEAVRNGFELALAELKTDRIKVIYEDDEFTPAKTVSAFNKLVNIENVDLIISIGSTPSNAVAPLAQAKKIPLIAWASDRNVALGRKYVIRSYPSGDAEGRRLAAKAKELNYNKIAVIISNNDYAQSWRGGLIRGMPRESIVLDEELTGDIKDFKPLLLKAASRGSKQLAVCLDPGKSGVLAKQARELGQQQPMLGCEYFHDRKEVEASHNALLGGIFATISVTDEFRRKYREKYGNDSIISGAANHYDIAYALEQAADKKNSEDLIKALLEIEVKANAAVGSFAIVERNDDRYFDIPLVIKRVARDGFPIVD
jgi:branched-chain amino acid transport system substrate-binding protein